jgi:hypothetical protein
MNKTIKVTLEFDDKTMSGAFESDFAVDLLKHHNVEPINEVVKMLSDEIGLSEFIKEELKKVELPKLD